MLIPFIERLIQITQKNLPLEYLNSRKNLRIICGLLAKHESLTQREIAAHLKVSRQSVCLYIQQHYQLISTCRAYKEYSYLIEKKLLESCKT